MMRRGFTLTELLVTIAIVGVIMTISVGVLSQFGHRSALDANHQAVRSLLRRAHNASREERFGAIVEIDQRTSELRAHQKTAITQFRFEDRTELPREMGTRVKGNSQDDKTPMPWETTGARGYTMFVDGGQQQDGRYGQGVVFADTGPEGCVYAKVNDRPALSPLEGVYVECWVYLGRLETRLRDRPRPRGPSVEQEEHWESMGEPPRKAPARLRTYQQNDPPIFYAVRKGRAYAIGITASYEIEVALTGPEDPEFTTIRRTRPGTLKPERWYRLALAFNGRRIQIFVDGIARVHLRPPGADNLSLFEELNGAGSDVTIDEQKVSGKLVLDAGELRAAGTVGERLLAGADMGGIGNGDGMVTTDEFLERVPSSLIRDRSPLLLSDPHPDRGFFGLIDEVKVAGIIRSTRLAIPANVALIAPEEQVSFDLLGQLDPARHAEPFVFYLTDDDSVWELLDPAPLELDPTKTLTRGQKAEIEKQRKNLQLGRGPYDRFLKALPKLNANRVRRVVVGRTGVVSE